MQNHSACEHVRNLMKVLAVLLSCIADSNKVVKISGSCFATSLMAETVITIRACD